MKHRFIAGMLTGAAVLGVGHFTTKGIVETVRDNKKNNTTLEEEDNREYFELEDGRVLYYDEKTNEAVVSDMSVSQAIENISTSDETITVETFEDLVARYAKPYIVNEIADFDTEMITKFVFMANINRIAEELPEFFEEFTSVHDFNEMMSDFGRVIGATNQYNANLRNKNGTLEDWIYVSDALFPGTQKAHVLSIEEQMEKIHEAAIKEDGELVNELVLELINELRSGSLSKLEDGVGMAAQIPISLIADNIAKDYLNEYNFNVLNGSIDPETGYRNDDGLKSSNKYVSNIQNIYTNGCVTDTYAKTLSR